MHSRLFPLILSGILCLPAIVGAEDWPQFRGPGGTGQSTESQIPTEWSARKNLQWKIKIPGYAWSCPIIWGDKVIVTTAISDKQTRPQPFAGGFGKGGFGKGGFGKGGLASQKPPAAVFRWEVYCLDRETGKEIWKQLAYEGRPTIPTHATNTYASETPVTDGERIYAYFGMTGLFCYDMTGKLLWKKNLGSYRMKFGWGTGSSPVLEGERLFVQCDNEEQSFLVALDRKTGEELWRVKRNEVSTWSTPFIWKNKQRTEVVTGGATVRSYDPATGKLLWSLGGMEGTVSPSPVGDRELLFFGVSGGFGGPGPLVAIKAGAAGDITLKRNEKSNAGVAWSDPRGGPSTASPLLYRDHLYILGRGTLTCYEARTGKTVFSRERLPNARGFTSSPWAADGKIYCLDENGMTYVIQAGPQFKVLAQNSLNDMFWSSPAIANGTLILRGADYLYCVKH